MVNQETQNKRGIRIVQYTINQTSKGKHVTTEKALLNQNQGESIMRISALYLITDIG